MKTAKRWLERCNLEREGQGKAEEIQSARKEIWEEQPTGPIDAKNLSAILTVT